MNTLATFFASIIALFSGLLGHASPPTTIQQPTGEVTQIIETASSTVTQNNINSSSTIKVVSIENSSTTPSATLGTVSTTETGNMTLSRESAKKLLFAKSPPDINPNLDTLADVNVKDVFVDGKIKTGKLHDYTRLVVHAYSEDWDGGLENSGDNYFVFATKDFKKYILDPHSYIFSSKFNERFGDQKYAFTSDVTIGTDNIPFDPPQEVISIGSFILQRGAPYLEPLTKDFKKMTDDQTKIVFYVDSSNILVKDEFGMNFSYELIPKETYIAHKAQPDYNKPNYRDYYFDSSEIKTIKPLYKKYGIAFPGSCGYGTPGLKEASGVKSEELQAIGTTTYGTTVYAPINSSNTFMQKEYDNKIRSIDTVKSVTIENYSEKNPLLFMKDPWGRWTIVGEWDYELEGGCGKPVIYLYPKNDTEVSVKINVPTTFSTQIPSYNDGWKVLAHPDGTLKNLQSERTDCSAIDYNKIGSEYAKRACMNNSYPYLYWSGNVGADYPTVNNGWTIKRENIKSFMEKKLDDIGFTRNERNDFIEYWAPEMLKKDAPFFRVSFITTQEMSRFIPMTVTPRPDSVYRLFMDWEPLAQNPSKQLEEQKLPTIQRTGFTLIEWEVFTQSKT